MDERFYNVFNSIDQLEIKKYGEVYTPECIAINMINKIPEEVWNNKNLKVLDFACGCGIFGYFIYKKLIQYFDHDYIINNILYFNDIQEKNINKIKYIFNNPRNIYHCNFLEWNCNIKFDVIIGNPPYQSHNKKRSNGNAIWHKFVDKLLKLLNENGYLSLIHPPGWRKPATNKCKYTYLYNELTQKRQMIYLEMYPEYCGVKYFGCYIMYDIYLVKNTKQHDETIICDHDGITMKLKLSELKFIPNRKINFIYNLLKLDGNPIKIINTSSHKNTNSQNDKKYIYPIVHSIRKTGPIYKYISEQLDCADIKKIIINPFARNKLNYLLDINGKYGISSSVFAISITDMNEANKIIKALNTEKFTKFKSSLTFTTSLFDFKSLCLFVDKIWDEFLKND